MAGQSHSCVDQSTPCIPQATLGAEVEFEKMTNSKAARLSHISHQMVSSQASSPASSSVPKIPRILRATPLVSTTCCMTSIGRSPSCAPWTSASLHTFFQFEIKPRRWIQETNKHPGTGKLDTEHQWEIESH